MTVAERRRRLLFVLLLSGFLIEGMMVLGIGSIARAPGGFTPSTLVIGLGMCFAPYAMVLAAARSLPNTQFALRASVLWLVVFGLAFVVAPPVLSDDVFRFVWEGRLWLEGFNPYQLSPSDPALEHLRDAAWVGINNKHLASIYPPLSQLLFALVASVGGGVTTIKLLALVAHVAAVFAVARLSSDLRAPLAIALNPLLLSAGALDGHLDTLTGLALLVSVWTLGRHRIMHSVVATSVAIGLKLVGLVFVPLFARRPGALAALALLACALLFPMAAFGPSSEAASGPLQFAATWQGNDSLYRVVEWLFARMLGPQAAMTAARGTVVVFVLALGLLLAVRGAPALRAGRILLWATLLLSPQVHPWYLAWLLPLEVVCGGFAGLVWSGMILCAYVPLDRWVTEGVWVMPAWLLAFEYGVVALGFLVEARTRRADPTGATSRIV